ncbi:hypothetical protein EWD52_23490 [Salmonella enterica subsp. enterica serovar Braenderup]|nr:hypothetical protein [Salmonella enterica subsp. enterica serovar Braenderup]ECD1500263.1 hypothetical protein [Salmonella enterica subsp. enterica serovar Braenderup]
MNFPSQEIKSSADFKTACQQSGREAIRILQWIQTESKEAAFLANATTDTRNEMFHKHRHLETAIKDIENALTPFAPDFNETK